MLYRLVDIFIDSIQRKRRYCFWYNFAVVEILLSLFLKHVGLLINVFCIYISSSGIKKCDASSSYVKSVNRYYNNKLSFFQIRCFLLHFWCRALLRQFLMGYSKPHFYQSYCCSGSVYTIVWDRCVYLYHIFDNIIL